MVNVQLTALLAEVGLNIQEAHAFSTVDGYSLDVFVVDGWPYEVLLFYDFSSTQLVQWLYPQWKKSGYLVYSVGIYVRICRHDRVLLLCFC